MAILCAHVLNVCVFGVDQCGYVCQCAWEHAMVAMGYTDGGSEPYMAFLITLENVPTWLPC